jgi:hypothetical protein
MKRFWIALLAVSLSVSATNSVEARRLPEPAKKKAKEYAKKAGEAVAQSEAWDATKRGAKKVKEKLQKECRDTQGGNNANSTAAVRTCS